MVLRSLVAAACLLAFGACSSSSTTIQPARTQDGQGQKRATRAGLPAMFEREVPPLAKRGIGARDHGWSAEIEASDVDVAISATSSQVSALFGPAQPLLCFVYNARIDVAGALWKVVEHTRKNVEYQAIGAVEVVPVGDYPVLLVRGTYLTRSSDASAGRGRTLGELKIAVWNGPTNPTLCLHDDPGYRQSFRRVVLGLFGSLKNDRDPEEPPPRFVELHVSKLDGAPIGYSRRVLYETRNTRATRVSTTLLLPRSATVLQFEDTDTVLELDARDQIVKGAWAKGIAGKLRTKLSLTRLEDGTFRYTGVLEGEKKQGTLVVPEKTIPSEIAIARALGATRAGAPLRVAEYHPTIDPTRLIDVVYQPDAKEPNTVAIRLGDASFVGTLDRQGLFRSITARIGEAEMLSERIHSRGTL